MLSSQSTAVEPLACFVDIIAFGSLECRHFFTIAAFDRLQITSGALANGRFVFGDWGGFIAHCVAATSHAGGNDDAGRGSGKLELHINKSFCRPCSRWLTTLPTPLQASGAAFGDRCHGRFFSRRFAKHRHGVLPEAILTLSIAKFNHAGQQRPPFANESPAGSLPHRDMADAAKTQRHPRSLCPEGVR